MSAYSYCVVPRCKSTSIKTPEKRFFSFPNDERRKDWLKAIRRLPSDISISTRCKICEDHFDLENDIENYIRFKYHPTQKVKFKKGVVPHKFDCQPDRNLTDMEEGINLLRKRAKLEEVGINIEEGSLIHQEKKPTFCVSSFALKENLEMDAIEALQMLSQMPLSHKKFQCNIR